MADRKKHVLSKVVKNIIFQNKTLLVMFYRHNKPFWYQFCNFKHFLKAENSENSLASSCEEFCISFPVTQTETGLLLELPLEERRVVSRFTFTYKVLYEITAVKLDHLKSYCYFMQVLHHNSSADLLYATCYHSA